MKKYFIRSHPRRVMMARLTGLVSGILFFALFILLYHAPKYNPISHGFDVSVLQAPDPVKLKENLTGTNGRVLSETHAFFRQDQMKLIFKGWLLIEEAGEYGFYLTAIKKAELRIDETDAIQSASSHHQEKPVTKRVFLSSGLHQITISFHSENLPALVDIKWAKPGSGSYRAIPKSRLYPTRPTVEQVLMDTRFKNRITTALLGIGALIVLVSVIGRLFVGFRYTGYYLKSAIALFVSLFSMHAPRLQQEHQAGLNWIIGLPLWARILTGSVVYLFLSGTMTPSIKCFRKAVKRVPKIRYCLGFLAVVTACTAQYLIVINYKNSDCIPIVLYVVTGILIWSIGFRSAPIQRVETNGIQSGKWLFKAIFVVVMAWAIWTRFYLIHKLPPGLWYDEAKTGRVVQDILNGVKPPIYDLRINAGTIASYADALWCRVVGSTDAWSLRSYTAFIGVLTVIASWWFFRELFSAWWSLFGVALMAGSRWLFMINRTAMATIDETILLTVLILTFYIRAIRRNRIHLYAITGLLVGLSMHLHTGARVLPIILGTDILIRLSRVRQRHYKQKILNAGVLIFCALVTFAPMGRYIYKNLDSYMKRSKETLITTEYPVGYLAKPYLNNIRYYLEMYVIRGDWHPRHNYDRMPQLATAASVLFVLGLFLSFRLFRRHPVHRLMLVSFCLVSLQGIMTVHLNSANLNRVAENIPVVMAWVVFGAAFVAEGIRKLLNRRQTQILIVSMMIGITGWIWQQEYIIYFYKYRIWNEPAGLYGFQVDVVEMARLSREILESSSNTHVWSMYSKADPFLYIYNGHPHLHVIGWENVPEIDRDFTNILLLPIRDQQMISRIEKAFPEGESSIVYYSLNPNVPLVWKMVVPPLTLDS
ncbi:MAG: glycosyltransferase family 39 protein [bacterium]